MGRFANKKVYFYLGYLIKYEKIERGYFYERSLDCLKIENENIGEIMI